MKELSLFSGAGGGLLGTMLLGWHPVGYVEWDDYCQRVIRQRIEDGYLPDSPIFGDIREFNRTYARKYRGLVDVVTAGFPCQPFSVAGKRDGADDNRNMWPATIDTICLVRPRYCLLENVPVLLSSGYFGTILGNLAESGYDCRWRILSAAEVGAPHRRDRLWVLCTDANHCAGSTEQERQYERAEVSNMGGANGVDVADADTPRLSEREGKDPGRTGTNGRADSGRKSWWNPEPRLGRLADGVAYRVDRLRATGNGQVPAVVAAVWRLLTEDV